MRARRQMEKILIYLASVVLIAGLAACPVLSQPAAPVDYEKLMQQGEYEKALLSIQKRLNEIYDTRVEDKRIVPPVLSSKKLAESINMNELFRKRKVEGFFIEDNMELHALHRAAGKCLLNRGEYDNALNHLYQSLRFKIIEYEKDDEVFYDAAQAYGKLKHREAHARALEAAYTLNPKKTEYSLELGRLLYSTADKKRAIFHIERYLRSVGDQLKDPAILLIAGNLSEDTEKYLETARYYKEYLKREPDNGYVHFALGYLACKQTGDHAMALASFGKALKLLPTADTYRRSKALEYTGDIFLSDLEYNKAIEAYLETIKYQDAARERIGLKSNDIAAMKGQINEVKSALIKSEDPNKYNEYEFLMDEKGKLEMEKRNEVYSFEKLNAGGVRWNLALCYERTGKLAEAVRFYRQCVDFNYKAGEARDQMKKLQLKITRGY
jgi:tetratricopeptide (TPR) repeat protein